MIFTLSFIRYVQMDAHGFGQLTRFGSATSVLAGPMPGDIGPHKLANHLCSRLILLSARFQKRRPERALDSNAQA
jgi:hypothetical protein